MKATSSISIFLAMAILPYNAQAQSFDGTYTREQCIVFAGICARNYESFGYSSSGACWDNTFASLCPPASDGLPNINRDYSIYYGPIALYYGRGGEGHEAANPYQ